jgi:hypothetical protein
MPSAKHLLARLGVVLGATGLAGTSACFKPPIVIVDGSEPAPTDGGRVAEAIVAVPSELSFTYDIGASGFSSQGPVDLAVLRELCRPHRLQVTESNIPFMGSLTAEMYTPRSITVTCLDSSKGRR